MQELIMIILTFLSVNNHIRRKQNMFQHNSRSLQGRRKLSKESHTVYFSNGSVNSKLTHLPGHLSSCWSRGWGFVRVRVAPGWGICQFFLKRLKSFLFNVSVKIYPYLDSFIKNICNTYALKRCVWFSLQHFHFLHPSKKLLPALLLKHGGKINEFKIKDTFFGREFSRQKGLEKLCEIFKSQ